MGAPLEWWTYALCGAALALHTATVLAYVLFHQLRNVAKIVVMHMGAALAVAAAVAMGLLGRHGGGAADDALCKAGTVALHYLLLVALGWMLAEGYHINRLFVDLFAVFEFPWRRVTVLCYGLPAVVAGVTAALRWDDYAPLDSGVCWLPQERGTRWALFGPLLAVCVLNVYHMGHALVVIHQTNDRSRRRSSEATQADQPLVPAPSNTVVLQATLSFFSVLGLFWPVLLAGLRSDDDTLIQTLLAAALVLHGLALFVFHAAADPSVREALYAWFSGQVGGETDQEEEEYEREERKRRKKERKKERRRRGRKKKTRKKEEERKEERTEERRRI